MEKCAQKTLVIFIVAIHMKYVASKRKDFFFFLRIAKCSAMQI